MAFCRRSSGGTAGKIPLPIMWKNTSSGPLEMHRGTALFIQPAQDPNCTKLYYHKEGKRQWCRDFYDNAFVLMGGGAVKSTLADMKQYLRMYLRGGVGPRATGSSANTASANGANGASRTRFQEQYGYGLSVQQLDEIPPSSATAAA